GGPGAQSSLGTSAGGATPTGAAGTTGGGFGLGGGGGTGGAAGVLPGVRITPDIHNNALLIYANQESYRIIERTLRQLDRKQLQVALQATNAEGPLDHHLHYGRP